MEKITYLVANYNNEKYIPDCMESILKQNSKNWKCVICDDASTDGSVSLLKTYLNEDIKLIINEKNLGYTKTLIKLIENAETDIIGIVDPDDAIYPDATECILNVYKKYKDAGFVYSKMNKFDEKLSKLFSQIGAEIKKGKTSLESGSVSQIKTFRKKYYYKTRGYNEQFLYCEDRDLIYKMDEVTELIYIDKTLYKYRFLENSASHDIKNRTTMINNHFNAVVEALDRRKINGFERFFYILHFRLKFIGRNIHFPKLIRIISNVLMRLMNIIDKVFKIRSGGELLR